MSGVFGDNGRYSSHKSFHDWQCYGIGGVGTEFRLWRLDVSFDVLARFCQDDMKVHSEAVSGKIERPDIILTCAVGFEF